MRDTSAKKKDKKRESDNDKGSLIKLDPYTYGGFSFYKQHDIAFCGGIPSTYKEYRNADDLRWLRWVSNFFILNH